MTPAEQETYQLYALMPEFRRHLRQAQAIIRDALNMGLHWGAAVSFGKDSICMLDLLLQEDSSIPVVFFDSGYQFPTTYQTRDDLANRYSLDLDIQPPCVDYFDLMRQTGLPAIERTPAQQQRVVQWLKKDRGDRWLKNRGLGGLFMGLRRQESHARDWAIKRRGTTYQLANGFWRCYPLADWTARDVWAYLMVRQLPYPDLYDKQGLGQTRETLRNTSWCTTDGAERGRITWLAHYYPEYYSRLVAAFPIVASYR